MDQDGYMIRMDQEVYISAWRVAWIRELGRIPRSDPFPSMADARTTSTGPPQPDHLNQTTSPDHHESRGSAPGLGKVADFACFAP